MPNDESSLQAPPMKVSAILEALQAGDLSLADAERRIHAATATEDLGYARVDHARNARQGFPEVIYGQGKTPDQIAGIARAIVGRGDALLVTRAGVAAFQAVAKVVPDATFHEHAGLIERRVPGRMGQGLILVAAAGTSDLPVAEEAAISAEVMNNRVERLYDVGVAGLHRLLAARERLSAARVIIVVAGMEGALASVVGGLVRVPVVAVPTSTGYGSSFHGLTALLAMLNSCASGVSVVNIDNGFGAAAVASAITHLPQTDVLPDREA
jgi:pyridinium-3,5-biscarboxylic acid mononucleotide synthase